MLLRFAQVFTEAGVFAPCDVALSGDRIRAVGENLPLEAESLDLGGKYLLPGLVDVHTHGAVGADFSDGDAAGNHRMAAYLLSCGVTSYLGTSMSLSETVLARDFALARAQVSERDPHYAVMRGVNMEGPFISKQKCGAQNLDYIMDPDCEMFRRLYAASGESIRLVDIAPETDGATTFIEQIAPLCTVSLAHTAATYDVSAAAYRAGAAHATHLFNGMNAFAHRDPGTVGAAMDFASHAELICDGLHVHPSVVRMVFRVFGDKRVCLISDSMRACGMPNGKYDLGGQEVTVLDGRATIGNGSLAGSVANLFACMKNAIAFGVPREQAILAATRNPAAAAHIDDEVGSIAAGKVADLLILDEAFELCGVIHLGQRVS